MHLICTNITKHFSGAVALGGVDFEVRPGEAHGLVGANGAGKSTLMKILSGALPDHGGTVTLDGEEARLCSPRDALRRGIAMVYQELSGVGSLSAAENLYLGRQPTGRGGMLAWRTMREGARRALARVGLDIDVTRRLDTFPLGVRQLIEIARGLEAGARLLILDEPTSALSPPETRRLFDIIRDLRAQGTAIVFISHFIDDVLEVCGHVTVLAGGRVRLAGDAAGLTKGEIIAAMLDGRGETVAEEFKTDATLPPPREGDPIMEARGLAVRGAFEGIDLAVRPGESLGLYGFVGAGHQELAHALAGAIRPDRGELRWQGEPLRKHHPATAVRRGIALVAADRKASLVAEAEIYKNVTLAHLASVCGAAVRRAPELAAAEPAMRRAGCHPHKPLLAAGSLSGGNQQKVVLAKWLLGQVRLLVLEEPTRGMDIAAKAEVMAQVESLRREGAAVVLATTEPELALAHADRILVMRKGRVTREFKDERVTEADLIKWA